MNSDKVVSKIINLMDEYKKLEAQHDFERAGSKYLQLIQVLFKKLAQKPVLFQEIIDKLLFNNEKPYVQIEIATEAIGMNYRVEEAIKVIESYATWQNDMTYQNDNGNICNTAQMRLHNLLGYKINYEKHECIPPKHRKITPLYKQFFKERTLF